jgi:hypothetical protein
MLGLDSAYEGTCDLCPSEHGLLYLKGLFPVLSIFLQMPHFILLYGWIILHCVNIPNFIYVLIDWRASGLIPRLGYDE